MRASAIEFRLRMVINTAIIVLGFWAPWTGAWGTSGIFSQRITMLEYLALQASRTGLLIFNVAAPALILCSALLAGIGAFLRVWGTAYLGTGIVNSLDMKAATVMADGPYRYVRNPLYLGLWCMVAAMAFIMPVTGALFTLALITAFMMRLIFAEEKFLSDQIGEPYQLYCSSVPRLAPRLRSNLQSAHSHPHWLRAILAELTPIGVFVALAFFSWTYDHQLMGRIILISFGVSLVTRALTPQSSREPTLAA